MFKRTIVCALFLTFGWASSIAAQPAPKPSDIPMPPLTELSDPNDTAVAFLELPKRERHKSTELGLPATYEYPPIGSHRRRWSGEPGVLEAWCPARTKR